MAKYSFETTTVGEMLDTPEIKALIEDIMPAILEHPLLEVGRTFIFKDALPYVADMTTDEEIDQFQSELEKLG